MGYGAWGMGYGVWGMGSFVSLNSRLDSNNDEDKLGHAAVGARFADLSIHFSSYTSILGDI